MTTASREQKRPTRHKAALVGRETVLAAAVAALDHAPSLVLVEGDAGIGKTRLLQECLAAPPLSGHTVLVAACPPLPEPSPLGPVVDGLRRLRRRVGDVELCPLSGALRPLFPEWSADLPPELPTLPDPTATRHRLYRAVTDLVERLGVDVLAVEDAHWADTATLEWLLTLCAAAPLAAEPGVSVVVSYRPPEVPADSLLRRLTSQSPVGLPRVRFTLEPLDVAEVRRLVAALFATDQVSEQFATFLHEHTGGVPLAVEETLLLLRDRHDIVRRDGAWTRRALAELQVPPTVRDSVLERVSRLGPDASAVLSAAAVLAAPAGAELLAGVAGLDERAGRAALSAALASGLLQETTVDRFVFRHALDAKAVGEAIQVSEWRRLHRRAAERVEHLDPPPVARLSRHFRQAGDVPAWSRYAEASADLALESGDDRTAVTVLLDLLTTASHPPDRLARLARKLGEVAAFGTATLGELTGRAADALREVLAGDLPPAELGAVRLPYGQLLRQLNQEQAGFAEIETAAGELSEHPEQAYWAMLILAMPLIADWTPARHLAWLERAGVLRERLDSPTDRLAHDVVRTAALLLLGDPAGWPVAAALPESGSAGREQLLVVQGMLNLVDLAMVWGRYAEARRRLVTVGGILQALDHQRLIGLARVAEAWLDWYGGDWDGLADVAAGLAGTEDSQPSDQRRSRQLLALLDLAGGARAAAEYRLRELAAEYRGLGAIKPDVVVAAAALGRLHLSEGAAGQALAETGWVLELVAAKGVWLWATDLAPVHVEALAGAGQLAAAESLVERFAGWNRDRDAPAPAAALSTCRALLAEAAGEPGTASALFGEAAAAWAALPRPYDELLATERRGRCLLAAGALDDGCAVLTDAERRLRQLGARWDADRVARLLRQHGVDVVRTWRRGPRGYGDQLSPRELEVVALVARGLTNRQVGDALFLSPKTVDRHLGASMRKLKVTTRTALAMAVAEQGLLPAPEQAGQPVTGRTRRSS